MTQPALTGTPGTLFTNSAAATFNVSVTVPSDAEILIYGFGYQGTGTPSSVALDPTGNNQAGTLIISVNDGTVESRLYYVRMPIPGSSLQARATWGTNRSAFGGYAACYKNIDIGNPIITTGTGATSGNPSVAVTTRVDDIAVDAVASAANPTIGGGQTSVADGVPNGANMTNFDGSYEIATALSTTMSWTLGAFYCIVAASLRASPVQGERLRKHFPIFQYGV